jgi:hypothetical protein
MEKRAKQDGIRSWCQLIKKYEIDGNKIVSIKKLENFITTVFHRNYNFEILIWIQDYKDAFTDLVILGKKYWDDDCYKFPFILILIDYLN